MTVEFKAFNKISHFNKHYMTVTQKIHGTNAQILIICEENKTDNSINVDGKEYTVLVGSRNKYITPLADNFGFASFIERNKESIIRSLGEGQHFGEWAGPGINSGEGLTEKTLVLFDFNRYTNELPPQTTLVPVLYSGPIDTNKITECMDDLKLNGSKLVKGFMRPEGIVVNISGTRMKLVFEEESTQWKHAEPKIKKDTIDVSHLLQPIRLQKLLSKDETYTKNYPETLSTICKDYINDLIEEGQITGTEDEIKHIKKALSSSLFKFVKAVVEGSHD